MITPLEQFLIKPIVRVYNNWIDLTITNSTVYLIISIIIIVGIFKIAYNSERYSYIIDIGYIKIEGIVKDMLPGEYKRYIPLLITIFIFILTNNLIGLVPYSFTTTAHLIMTFSMSLSIMIGVTLIGILKHKLKFFNLFLPQGLNQGYIKLIIPLIVTIEIISYLIRIISLSVRLSANLISGHTLIKIIANFGLKYSLSFPLFLFIPVALLSAIYLLEIGVAIIQAYVFTLLTTTYIRDTELLH